MSCLFTFERKNLPSVSLADFPFEGSGSFTAAFGCSFGVGFDSPLISTFGGSGGGGGGTGIALGAAGGSDTCATYSRKCVKIKFEEKGQTHFKRHGRS